MGQLSSFWCCPALAHTTLSAPLPHTLMPQQECLKSSPVCRPLCTWTAYSRGKELEEEQPNWGSVFISASLKEKQWQSRICMGKLKPQKGKQSWKNLCQSRWCLEAACLRLERSIYPFWPTHLFFLAPLPPPGVLPPTPPLFLPSSSPAELTAQHQHS